jgi:hypothetical protein
LRQALRVLERGGETGAPRVAYVELELSHIDSHAGDSAAAQADFKAAHRILDKIDAETRRRERNI